MEHKGKARAICLIMVRCQRAGTLHQFGSSINGGDAKIDLHLLCSDPNVILLNDANTSSARNPEA